MCSVSDFILNKICKNKISILNILNKISKGLAKIFKDHFENIVEILHIEHPCKVDLDREPVVNAIKNFSQQASITKIKENTNFSVCFSFHTVSKEDLLYQLNSLDPTKATKKCDIPRNIIKKNYDIFSDLLFANLNDIILTFF